MKRTAHFNNQRISMNSFGFQVGKIIYQASLRFIHQIINNILKSMRVKKLTGILFILVLLAPLSSLAQTYNINDFGAVADGKTLNTSIIQLAIDKCFADGGGEVVVPAGVFYSGTIFLKSNVYLPPDARCCITGKLQPG